MRGPVIEAVRQTDLSDAVTVSVDRFEARFRELNNRQCETAHKILYMMLAVMEVKVDR